KTSLKGWHSRWFYTANPDPSLLAYVGRRPEQRPSWISTPSLAEMRDVQTLLKRLEDAKISDEVSGVGVVRNFIGRRTQPIKERVHPAYEYSGLEDPTRESPDPWGIKALNDRVSSLFQNDVNVNDAPHPAGYTLKNL